MVNPNWCVLILFPGMFGKKLLYTWSTLQLRSLNISSVLLRYLYPAIMFYIPTRLLPAVVPSQFAEGNT